MELGVESINDLQFFENHVKTRRVRSAALLMSPSHISSTIGKNALTHFTQPSASMSIFTVTAILHSLHHSILATFPSSSTSFFSVTPISLKSKLLSLGIDRYF